MRTVRNILLICLMHLYSRVAGMFGRGKKTQWLLFIKLDAIGDYVIARNFIEIIKKNPRFHNHKILLLGNTLWQDLSEEIDKDNIDAFHFVEPARYNNNISRQAGLIRLLNRYNIDTVINLHRSRNPLSEIVSMSLYTSQRFAVKGGFENSSRLLYSFANLFYKGFDQDVNMHEFDLYRAFTSFILRENISIDRPYINYSFSSENQLPDPLPEKYLVFANGAGVTDRIMESKLVYKMISFLLDNYNGTILFTGNKKEYVDNEIIIGQFAEKSRLKNIAGKTSLPETAYIIQNAEGVICYDSGMYHLSIALEKKLHCIAGGGHFKRFVSYMDNSLTVICYSGMPCFNCGWQCTQGYIKGRPYPCIEAIEVSHLLESMKVFLKKLEFSNDR